MLETRATRSPDSLAGRARRDAHRSIERASPRDRRRADSAAVRLKSFGGWLVSETFGRSPVQDVVTGSNSPAIIGVRILRFSSQQEFLMANDKPRQQSSERAQTSSGSAQQGEWQPSQRSASGQQGGYPQESQAQSTSRDMTSCAEAGQYPTFGP